MYATLDPVDTYGWLSRVVVSVRTGPSQPLEHYVFLGCSLKCSVKPWQPGGDSSKGTVVTLVDGRRRTKPSPVLYHIDLVLEWSEMDQAEVVKAKELALRLRSLSGVAEVFVAPRANDARTAPHPDYEPVQAIPSFGAEIFKSEWADHIVKRPFSLEMLGVALVAEGDIPFWLKR